ncbi:hypothetical protein [Mesonia maritima]|uniref:Outer membrane protein beta-barrel domain-containing protein n=1 Tax=Mesonia maritima TaxID=1793873 RepID=A0ABU1K6Q8_9FLAO|nr:hypothetical protein [Mesonia maritima]MDR6301297.1 hypothetical protein [Mesonia maritima]
MKKILIPFFLSLTVFAQDENSKKSENGTVALTANAGLALADDHYGQAFNFEVTKSFQDSSLTLGLNFSYADIQRENETDYNIFKYALLAGTEFAKSKTFKFNIIYGLSLLQFENYDKEDTAIGVDAGISMSYNLTGPLYFNLGAATTFNKETNIFMQSFLGFKVVF